MTQDEIIAMAVQAGFKMENSAAITAAKVFYKLVAAKALAQPEQEPRNVRERWNVELDGNDLLVCFNNHEKGDKCQYERYSPQRTWVGLTDEEFDELDKEDLSLRQFVQAIEDKLKEKNT
jgi:elongation factor P--beta-lysine ligase